MSREKKPSETGVPGKPDVKKTPVKKSPAKKAVKKSAAVKVASTEVAAPLTQVLAAPVEQISKVIMKSHPGAVELYEEIRRRAYQLYQERGGQHGSDEADWHRAETEVRAKYR